MLLNLYYFVKKVITKFFTFVWGGFNWLAGRGTNHSINSFRILGLWPCLAINSEKWLFLASLIVHWYVNISSFREASETLTWSFFHFLSAILHRLFKILSSSFSHGREWGFCFLSLTGAIESRIFVQELVKPLTSSSTGRPWHFNCVNN